MNDRDLCYKCSRQMTSLLSFWQQKLLDSQKIIVLAWNNLLREQLRALCRRR